MKKIKFFALVAATMLLSSNVNADSAIDKTVALDEIAKSNIEKSVVLNEDGTETILFDDIDVFVETAREISGKTDYEIGCYIAEYTGLDYMAMPEADVLELLECTNMKSITTACNPVSDNDVEPLGDTYFDDGMMYITTNYTYVDTTDSGVDQYKVYSMAKWLRYPVFSADDCFTIGTTAEFNDEEDVSGQIVFSYTCSKCENSDWRQYKVSNTQASDDILYVVYESFKPVLHFNLPSTICSECKYLLDSDPYFTIYLRYGINVDLVATIQAAYGHTTYGLGTPSVSFDAMGMPNISAGVASDLTKYNAVPVSVLRD